MQRKYVYLFVLIVFCTAGYTQSDSIIPFDKVYKRVYNITKVSDGSRPVMDGRLNEVFGTKQGEWSEPLVQVSPVERKISDSPTQVKILHDNRYIYCKDAIPEKMNAFIIGNREDNSIGNLISIAFDTYCR